MNKEVSQPIVFAGRRRTFEAFVALSSKKLSANKQTDGRTDGN
jgi:hypothetical protein